VEIFNAMNRVRYFLYIFSLEFLLKEKFLPSNFEKILWNNKLIMVPLVDFKKNKIKMTFASYENLGFES
jgi:hypothetical protein